MTESKYQYRRDNRTGSPVLIAFEKESGNFICRLFSHQDGDRNYWIIEGSPERRKTWRKRDDAVDHFLMRNPKASEVSRSAMSIMRMPEYEERVRKTA